MADRKLLQEIFTKKWLMEVSRKFNWFVEWGQIQANTKKFQEKYVGFSIPTENYLILNGDEYYIEDDMDDFYLFFENKFKEDKNFFGKFAQKIFDLEKEVLNYTNWLRDQNTNKLTNDELLILVKDFSEVFVKSMVHAWVRPDMYLEEMLSNNLRRKLQLTNKEIENVISKIATYPEVKVLAYTQEPLDLLKIAKKINDSDSKLNNLPSSIEKKLSEHISKYCWLKGPVSSENVAYERKDYIERLEIMLKKDVDKEIEHILQTRKRTHTEYKNVIRRYKISGTLLKLAKATQDFTFLRTYSAENNERLFFVFKTVVLREVSKRTSIPISELTMLEPKEIISLLRGKSNKKDVKKIVHIRKLGFAILWIDGELTTLFGNEATLLQKRVSSKFIVKDAEAKKRKSLIIKGASASLGHARGTVKIVLSHNDVGKVNLGDILVSSMTNPDFIIAIEKAAAFITDEGGITCHAAIVAREFGVPCIVGTVNATKILKDGNLVEVDANKGVVKIIK